MSSFGELAPLLDGRHDGVRVAQTAKHACVRRVARLALLAVLQAELHEEDLGELLRRGHREALAGEAHDLVVELVDAIAQTGGDLAQTVRVHLDPGRLHLREHVHERQLDLAEEPLETELDEARALGLGHAPREHGARGRVRLGAGALDEHGAVLGAGQGEQAALLLGTLGRQQVRGHRRVEAGPARRRPVAGLRLGVVHHGVRGEQPEGGRPAWTGDGHLHGLAAAVDGDRAAVVAVLLPDKRHGGLGAFERRRQRAHVGLVDEAHAGTAGRTGASLCSTAESRAAPSRRRPLRAGGGAGCGTRTSRRRRQRSRRAARSRRAPRARRDPPRAARRAPWSRGAARGALRPRARPAARAASHS